MPTARQAAETRISAASEIARCRKGTRIIWVVVVRLPREFIARAGSGRSVEAGHEVLSSEQRAGEALMLGLRLTGGIDTETFGRRFGAGALESRREVSHRSRAAA